ncbi:thioredoxin family protein [Hymenobacter sp. BT770]|uniref:thioredoxin family protein n=1 Tax=Hymenobacter sp. BT770 TaxID=2886942 RepID=UPI001D1115E3|nr:thioredoxin family protein [Hymenobacter sp. BT770]MCC3153913.1 thioredoxin family protein [Hymenobacter sp. BT770]MDO3416157.1 thioredoxin family protein [Hymenobacter sp. BT770]
MRYLFYWLFMLSTLTAHGQRTGVAFQGGKWTEVLAAAKKAHKPVFFYAWSPSCSPCVGMSRDVFPDTAVARYYNAHFVSYKANIDEGEGKALSTRYGIRSLPAYLYFTAEGKPLHRSGGGKPAAEFIQDGQDALNPSKAYFALKDRYASGDRTAALLYAFSKAPGIAQEEALHTQVTGEYLKTQSAQEMSSQKNLEYIFNQFLPYESLATQYFLQHQAEFVPKFGQEAVTRKSRELISNAANALGHKNDKVGLGNLQQSIARLLPAQAKQWQELAQVQYFMMQRNWPAYVDATLAYGQQFAAQDSFTLNYATAILTAFVDDKALLAKGDQIIQQAIAADRSHFYLLTRAKLLHKLGNDADASTAAMESIAAATKAGANHDEATEFLAEIKK